MSQAPGALPRALPLEGPPQQIELRRPLSAPEQLTRALWRARGRTQGRLPEGALQLLGPIEVRRRRLVLDRARVARFRAVCAVGGHADVAPAAFLQTLFLAPMATVVLNRSYPFSPLGLVHLRQRIEQRRAVKLDERLDLRCWLAELRETSRGFESDCGLELRSGDEPVWLGSTTFLSRGPRTRSRGGERHPPATPAAGLDGEVTTIAVPGDVGRRYARASGDYNPHHLFTLTARLVGFRKPIAQGMWTLARAISELGATESGIERLVVEGTFKRPVFMPGVMALRAGAADGLDEEGRPFEVFNPQRGEPHLVGRVCYLR